MPDGKTRVQIDIPDEIYNLLKYHYGSRISEPISNILVEWSKTVSNLPSMKSAQSGACESKSKSLKELVIDAIAETGVDLVKVNQRDCLEYDEVAMVFDIVKKKTATTKPAVYKTMALLAGLKLSDYYDNI